MSAKFMRLSTLAELNDKGRLVARGPLGRSRSSATKATYVILTVNSQVPNIRKIAYLRVSTDR